MSEHSKEPWVFGTSDSDGTDAAKRAWLAVGVDHTPVPIAIISRINECNDLDTANARRIVACVNFCKGKPTELLEAAADFDAVPDDAEFEESHPVFKLAEDNDKLRELLRQAQNEFSYFGITYGSHSSLITKIDKVLKK